MRSLLLSLARSSRLRDAAVAFAPTRAVVDRFVAGDTLDDCVATCRSLVDEGLLVTVDHLGEDTTTREQALATTQEYLRLLERIGAEGLASRVEASVKLSSLGLGLPGGADLARENVERILHAASEVGTTITFDMEDHTTTDATLALLAEVRREFPATGVALPAYLHRTPADCAALATPGSRVRLCKGAYAEPASVALTDAAAVDAQYLACLRTLMKGAGRPLIATHDPRLIEAALAYSDLTGRGTDTYEFQMLHGVREAEQRRLVAAGQTVRVYVPYGTDWYAYFVRRLAERPANLMVLARALALRS